MIARIEDIKAELDRWSRGVLAIRPKASAADLSAAAEAIGQPLPPTYSALLGLCNGADLHGDRMLSIKEAVDAFRALRTLTQSAFREDPDWPHRDPPDHLLPIAVDLEGNLKCLDLSTQPAEVLDWHRESGAFNTWHADVLSWFLTAMKTLSVNFDHRGRPRPLRAGDSDSRHLRELEVHLAHDPRGSYPLLERALWLADTAPPELASQAFREAALGIPERAINHYEHACWAIRCHHWAEARRALRRCLAVPQSANPKKHSFRTGHLPAAHRLLAELYDRTLNQPKKADEQRRAAERALRKYGSGGFDQNPDYQDILQIAKEAARV